MYTDARYPFIDITREDYEQPEPAEPWPPAGQKVVVTDPHDPWGGAHLEPCEISDEVDIDCLLCEDRGWFVPSGSDVRMPCIDCPMGDVA